MCTACEEFDTEVSIHGPDQLRRIAEKIRVAVESGELRCNQFESDRALIGQPAFSDLDLADSIPDVIRYYFECPSCGAIFALVAEAYHGHGGMWSRV